MKIIDNEIYCLKIDKLQEDQIEKKKEDIIGSDSSYEPDTCDDEEMRVIADANKNNRNYDQDHDKDSDISSVEQNHFYFKKQCLIS